jgi:hypothetical protein
MKCNIWLTLNNDNPDLEDIAKIRYELEDWRNWYLSFFQTMGSVFNEYISI